MGLRIVLLLPLFAGLRCAAEPETASLLCWDDLAAATSEARAAGKPLLVVSIVGDLRKRC